MPMIKLFFCLFNLILLNLSVAYAANVNTDIDFASSEDKILAWIDLKIPDGYHAYGNEPGPTGFPTNLEFTAGSGLEALVIYPRGEAVPDSFEKDKVVNIYSGTCGLLAILPENSKGETFSGELNMLLCSDRHCLPYKKQISGVIPDTVPPLFDAGWKNEALALLQSAHFAPKIQEDKARPAEIDVKNGANQSEEEYDLDLDPRIAADEPEIYSLGKALLLGLCAGLLLNAMPCVLPVLTLKVSGLILMGGAGDKKKIREFRLYNLFFALGILTLFTGLALLLGLADFMWGQLFQSEIVLLGVLIIVFLMALSMLGVFTLPAFDARLGEESGNPLLRSYCSGLVSTFLATPCSGPLLGGVLAWSLTQPLPILVAVLWSVGAGMGLPYIIFCIWPDFAKILPRPGEWMLTVERILGFLLLATALYLVYILPSEKRIGILALLLLAGFCAWLWGTFAGLSASKGRKRWIGALSIALLAVSFWWTLKPAPADLAWQQFEPEEFVSALGRKEMLVEFTADWCPNCKFLEASVLTDGNLRKWQKKYGFELIRVDLTRSNPLAEKLLAQLGSKSIPLTALFPAGARARYPLVLRDIYSEGELNRALSQIF